MAAQLRLGKSLRFLDPCNVHVCVLHFKLLKHFSNLNKILHDNYAGINPQSVGVHGGHIAKPSVCT
jgi:hypothetical protein